MEWLNPLAYKMPGASILMDELAAGPPPPNVTWESAALLSAVTPPGFWDQPITNKMIQFVRSYLYATQVVETPGDPVPDPPTPPPVPTDLPPPPPPLDDISPAYDTKEKDLHKLVTLVMTWVDWMRRQIVPREGIYGIPQSVTGSGVAEFPATFPFGDFTYATTVIGFQVDVQFAPGFKGHSSGSPQLVYDLGNIAWNRNGASCAPVKLLWSSQIFYPVECDNPSLTYNLAPGVGVMIRPIYPSQSGPPPSDDTGT
jgi:hypothetical protein